MVHHACHDHEPFVIAQVQNFAAQETVNSESWVRNTLAVLGLIPYLLDQTPFSISHRSRIIAAPPDVLNEIVAALEY